MENSQEYLILDAAKGVGHAFIQNLIKKNITVTIGRAQDKDLAKVCEGKKFLFMSYNSFHGMDNLTRQQTLEEVVKICTTGKIRIVYCVSIFDTWSHGGSLIKSPLEEMLLDATVNNGARVTIVRFPSCWGPNMSDWVLEKVFRDASKKHKLWYPVNPDIPCQFVYIEDAAEVIYRLTRLNNKDPWQVYNYGGNTYSTARSFLYRISEIAESPKKIVKIRKWQIWAGSLVSDRIKELKNRLPFYKDSPLLDDPMTNGLLADFKPFPVDKAIEDTLAWYEKNVSIAKPFYL